MKKIIIMTGSMNVGGIEKALIEMLKIIPYEKYDVTLLLEQCEGVYLKDIPKEVQVITDDNIRYCLYSSRKQQLLNLLHKAQLVELFNMLFHQLAYRVTKNMCKYFKWQCSRMNMLENKYDIAIAYHNPFRFPGSYVINNINADIKILWNHTDLKYFKEDFSYFEDEYSKYDYIYNVSESSKESLISRFPKLKSKMRVFYNIINSKEIAAKADEYEPFKKSNKWILLTVGRLSDEKGQDRIPDIANILIKKGYSFEWYIVGDGNTREKIEKKIRQYKLEKYIFMEGNKSNPYPYMKACDIYVQTSWQEGFPMVIGEVLTFAKACVVTNVGGTMEYFQNENEVELVNENTNKYIADGIINLIDLRYNTVKNTLLSRNKSDLSSNMRFEKFIEEVYEEVKK